MSRMHYVMFTPTEAAFTDGSLMFSRYCFSQNLQNSQGQQREFGDGQRDRRKNPSPTASEEDNVILSSIRNQGIQGQKLHLIQRIKVFSDSKRLSACISLGSAGSHMLLKHSMRGNHGNGLPVQLYFP